ncbi:hypothetical protein KNU79_gp64 [Gordonia phage NadineRae]|uniref:Uncharacterized protein n=1 Tax=Gordonia phage NadineRae TaxID=2652882 RepID=A0A5P8DFI0_9CAUD|nr:hypothetical protein KNU79_gp64 [Gordonia phage NadineRae]QFP97747.1 hypothetical protein SEA_NADINERAE_64 [Gordonia phage NadineRae]
MGIKLKLNIGAEAAKVEAVTGFKNYTGPTPPVGVYGAVIKQLQIKPTKAGDKTMLVAIVEFDAPKGHENAKYNGYAIFHRLVIPESMEDDYVDLQVGQINRLLDAISGDEKLRSVFWGGNAVLDDKGEKITKLGKFSLAGKGFKGIPVVVSTKNDSYVVKEKVDGKIEKKTVRQLRINDIYPSDHEVPASGADDEIIEDDDVDTDDIIVDDDSDDETAAVEPDEDDEDDSDDSDDDEVDYVDEDSDEDGYVADEDDDDDEPEPEPEPEPKKTTGRKRRSAF